MLLEFLKQEIKSVRTILMEESADLIRRLDVAISPIDVGGKPYLPVDVDIFPFDNSDTSRRSP